MPVLKPITTAMDCLKSAEFIQELKAETEKIVCKENSSRKPTEPNTPADLECHEHKYLCNNKSNHVATIRRNVIPYPDHNYGQQPPLTPPGLNSPDLNEQTDTGNEDEDEEGVTRCICGFSHDDGYMICCDRCGTWQHVECMGIKSDSVPDTYLCDRCEPRTLDVERARAIQSRKKDQRSDDDGDEDTDTDDELHGSTSYKAISNTPTRITLTATSTGKNKSKNQLKNSGLENQGKRRKLNRKRQRKYTRPGSEGVTHNDSNSMDAFICHDAFQTVESCIYDEAVMNLKLPSTNSMINNFDFDRKMFGVSEVQENRKGLVAIEDIKAEQPIAEYKGRVSLLSIFEERSPFFKRAHPFVLYYNKIDKLELAIDARLIGNEARYVQRSCEPNSETRHIIEDGKVHVIITCTKDIPKGAQITIPFEYSLETYMGYINCACNQVTCLASQYNQKFLSQSGRKRARYSIAESSTRNSASENQGDTDTDDNEVDVGTGERPLSRRKKLSREERKLQAYVKQIEKMEKKEKKNPKAVTHRPMQLVDSVQSQSLCSVSNRMVNSNGVIVTQNPLPPVARRISTGAPGSAKKRLSVSKKRPRISSCSSDPLSPDLSSLVTVTAAPTTPVHESVLHSFSLEQNGLLKQKSRKDKDQLSLSMSFDKPAALRDATRKLRKEYVEAKAGSPTPPTTPGQLSPASRTYADQSLSVDVTNSLTSPSMSFSQDRRNVLNGLLQIADETDNDSSCSGSPLASNVTSNGMATAEEVMGDIMLREPGMHTPTGKVINRRISRDCGYYGSLKKRWLVQYDSTSFCKPRPINGAIPLSLSSLISDYSIRKRADQISSSSFRSPQNCIPLKKRRLRAALAEKRDESLSGETTTSEITSEEKIDDNSEPSTKESDRDSKPQESDVDKTSTTEIVDGDNIIAEGNERKDVEKDGANDVAKTVENVTPVDLEQTSNKVPEVESSKEKSKNEEQGSVLVKIFEEKIEKDIVEKFERENKANFKGEEIESIDNNEDGLRLKNEQNDGSIPECGLDLEQKCTENSVNELNKTEDSKQANLLDSESVTSDKVDLKAATSSNESTPEKNPPAVVVSANTEIDEKPGQIYRDETMNASIQASQVSTVIPATQDSLKDSNADSLNADEHKNVKNLQTEHQISTSVILNETSANIHVAKTDSIVSSCDNYPTRTDSLVTVPIGVEPERLSAMIRDPRLSSSSSRSSRDSLDNVFIRSDSVGSVDETPGQRLDVEKRSLSGSVEKLDATPGGKKKVSLREYRNRKKTQPQPPPSVAVPSNPAKNIEVPAAKPQEEAPTTLFTDTDSLLTPRTLTLSAGFGSREAVTTGFPPSSKPPASPGLYPHPGPHPEAIGLHPSSTGLHTSVPGLYPATSVLHSAASGPYPSAAGQHITLSGQQPTASGIHHTSSGLYPAASGLHPTATGIHPSASGLHPTALGSHPAATGQHPSESGLHPDSSRLHPDSSRLHPASSGLHPASSGLHPAATGLHHPALGLHHAASGMHPPASGLHPASPGLHPAATGSHHSALGMHQAASGLHPSASHPTASVFNPAQPAIHHNPSVQPSTPSMLHGSSVSSKAIPVVGAAPFAIPQASTPHSLSAVMYQSEHHLSTGPMFEPVSPGDDYVTEPGHMDHNKQVSMLSSQPFVNYTNVMSNAVRHSLPGSPIDAMEIDDELTQGNKIQVGMPHLDARKHYLQNTAQNFDRQGVKSLYHMQQIRGLQLVNRNIDNRSPNNKQSQNYNKQFRS